MKKTSIAVFLFVFMFALILVINHKNAIIFRGSFAETKQILFTYLGANENDFSTRKTAYVSPDAPAANLIGYGGDISMEIEPESERLSIVIKREYNIGASGNLIVYFEIMPVDETQKKIIVDYEDSWVGIWPPFIWWSPGIIMKHRIIKSLEHFIHERKRND